MKRVIYLLVILFSLTGISYSNNTDSGLVAHYKFSGNINDESGNLNNGYTVNNPSYYTDRFNNPNSALSLNGVNQYAVLPASIILNSNMSFSFWICTLSSDPNPFYFAQFLIDRDICNWYRDWDISLGLGGKIIFTTGTTQGDFQLATKKDVNTGIWKFLTVVYDSLKNQKRIYIDGVLNNSAGFTATPYVNNYLPIYVGASVCGPLDHELFRGAVDELRIYNRVLTENEISEIYLDYPTDYVRVIPQGLYDYEFKRLVRKDTVTINVYSGFIKSLLHSETSVLDSVTFIAPFNYQPIHNFFMIEVKHKNSVAVRSNFILSDFENVFFDFTNLEHNSGFNVATIDSDPYYRTGIYSGDINQDGLIDITDISLIDNDMFNIVTGYSVTDLNGDNIVDIADANLADYNSFMFIQSQ